MIGWIYHYHAVKTGRQDARDGDASAPGRAPEDRQAAPRRAEDGTEVEREIPFMKGYTVFNVDRDMPPTPARISR
jgi:antirestriction protein ArdC